MLSAVNGFLGWRVVGRGLLSVGVAVLLGTALPAHAFAEPPVVMEAVGTSWRAGDQIDPTKPLTLNAGERIGLITDSGEVLRFTGPATVAPAQLARGSAEGGYVDALRALVARLDRTGTLRSARSTGPTIDNPNYIDVSRPGSRCIREQGELTLWRPSTGKAQTLTIGPAGAGWAASVEWPSDSELLALDDQVKFKDGDKVVAELDGVTNDLDVHVVPRAVKTPAAQAAWMIEKGCEPQAVAIIRGLIGN